MVHWHRRYRREVNVVIDPFHGGPLQLVQHAVEAKRRSQRDERQGRGRAYDEIWCVFDVDQHPELATATDLARRHGVCLAISNPCIELWFVLHFQDQTAYIERADAQALSKTLLGCEKALTESALTTLDKRVAEARDRAQRLDLKHHGDGSLPGSNPSSGVWRLVEAIQAA